MAEQIDLRRQRPAAPSARETETRLPGEGRLPLPSGEVRLSETERSVLEKCGWQEGEPVPDMSAVVAEINREITADEHPAADKSPLSMPEIIDFDNLSPEHQDRLRDALQRSIDQQKRLRQAESQMLDEAGPGVNDAIRAASEATAAPPDAGDSGNFGGSGNSGSTPDPGREPEPEPEPEPDRAGTGRVYCPRCNHDLRKGDDVEVNDDDKYRYVVSVLGNHRYTKEYSLMGGKLRVRFRTLTTAESDMALQQCSYDLRDRKITEGPAGTGEFFRVHMNYRMALSLDRLQMGNHVRDLPTIDQVKWDEPGPDQPKQTPLPSYMQYLADEVITHESVRRTVGLHLQDFQRHVEKLEARMDDSDFWKGIEPPS